MCFPFSDCWKAHYFLSLSSMQPCHQFSDESQSACTLLPLGKFFSFYWKLLNWLFYFLDVLLFLYMTYLLFFTFIQVPIHILSLKQLLPSGWNQIQKSLLKQRSKGSGTYSEKFRRKMNKWWMNSEVRSDLNMLEMVSSEYDLNSLWLNCMTLYD